MQKLSLIENSKDILDDEKPVEHFVGKAVVNTVPAIEGISRHQSPAGTSKHTKDYINAEVLSSLLGCGQQTAQSALRGHSKECSNSATPSWRATVALAHLAHNPLLACLISHADNGVTPLSCSSEAQRLHLSRLRAHRSRHELNDNLRPLYTQEFASRVKGGAPCSKADPELIKIGFAAFRNHRLQPEQVDALVNRLDLPVTGLAEVAGLSRQSIHNYRSGARPCKNTYAIILGMIAFDPIQAVFLSRGRRIPENAVERSKGAWAATDW